MCTVKGGANLPSLGAWRVAHTCHANPNIHECTRITTARAATTAAATNPPATHVLHHSLQHSHRRPALAPCTAHHDGLLLTKGHGSSRWESTGRKAARQRWIHAGFGGGHTAVGVNDDDASFGTCVRKLAATAEESARATTERMNLGRRERVRLVALRRAGEAEQRLLGDFAAIATKGKSPALSPSGSPSVPRHMATRCALGPANASLRVRMFARACPQESVRACALSVCRWGYVVLWRGLWEGREGG